MAAAVSKVLHDGAGWVGHYQGQRLGVPALWGATPWAARHYSETQFVMTWYGTACLTSAAMKT